MNYQNPNYICNILYNYNQRLYKIEQNISQLFIKLANNNKKAENEPQESVDGLVIPKFRFVATIEELGDLHLIDFVF